MLRRNTWDSNRVFSSVLHQNERELIQILQETTSVIFRESHTRAEVGRGGTMETLIKSQQQKFIEVFRDTDSIKYNKNFPNFQTASSYLSLITRLTQARLLQIQARVSSRQRAADATRLIYRNLTPTFRFRLVGANDPLFRTQQRPVDVERGRKSF